MTKKEFAKLKVGDKVKIKKSVPKDNPIYWSNYQDEYLGKIVTIDKKDGSSFRVRRENVGLGYRYWFSYKLIDSVIVDEVDEILNSKPKTLPDSVIYSEERIKQLEDEIKALKEEQKHHECYEQNKKTGEAINNVIEGMMAGGLSREEAFELVKMTYTEFMANPNKCIFK